MRYIKAKSWNDLTTRALRGEWLGGILALLFLVVVLLALFAG